MKGTTLKLSVFGTAVVLMAFLVACTASATGEPLDDDAPEPRPKSSSSAVKHVSSSSVDVCDEAESDSLLAYCDSLAVADSIAKLDSIANKDSLSKIDPMVRLDSVISLVEVSATGLNRGSSVFSVEPFAISKTEVTQGLFEKVMGYAPKMDRAGDDVAVANVNWYEAVLFCNALSVSVGLDTAYVYEAIGDASYLRNVAIDYEARAVRLPTETEWEIAYRAGTTTTYYWNTDVASKYAYYAQTKGPVKVAQYKPNALGLYDMGGNVAEWVNDWYGSYPTKSVTNYTGASDGSYRVVRGGGWSDKAPSLAAAERDKKDPLYQSQMVGFRVLVTR